MNESEEFRSETPASNLGESCPTFVVIDIKPEASKEAAKESIVVLGILIHPQSKEEDRKKAREWLYEFLHQVVSRLPTEEAIRKDKKRKARPNAKSRAKKRKK